MKKILAILSVFTVLFSLASCKMQNNKTTAERVSEAEAEQSMLVESSIQAETVREEKIIKNIDDIGKSKKGEQLVIKMDDNHYQVYVMNKKNICQKVLDYYFLETMESYLIKTAKASEKTRQKLVQADPEARMVVFESEYDVEEMNSYDQIYELHNTPESKEAGIIIIE